MMSRYETAGFLLDSIFIFWINALSLSRDWYVTVSALFSIHFMLLQSQKSKPLSKLEHCIMF